ncbi:33911_t:CDS:10 [Gigaspora margarita]|uniref:33911_t:CDS:1 n=1 Tax=Gigaspora margarita TaxID=4874 RepID=A0ABN7UA28_GIGMA|nr:33911_t:CDS:10 [Gigaspora margarita]
METPTCTRCNHKKSIDELTRPGVMENKSNLELIEPMNLCSYFIELLNTHLKQLDDDPENVSLFLVLCAIDILIYDKSIKEIAEELIELIKDVDSTILMAKPRKHEDPATHRDMPLMERFDCHELGQNRYKHQDNTFESALQWLKEGQHKIILEAIQPVHALAVMIGLDSYLLLANINVHKCGIDASYNTNNFKIELFVFKLKQMVQNGIKIQLCKWHIKRAVISRLASNKEPRNALINPLSEFCSRFPFDEHFYQQPLIPTCNGQFITRESIHEATIQEAYFFCKNNLLVSLCSYLWCKWYSDQQWQLWARSACENKISSSRPICNNSPSKKITADINWKRKPEWIKQFNQFGICKHLVQQKEPASSEFIGHIKRNHQLQVLNETKSDNNLFEIQLNPITKTLTILDEQKVVANP